MSCGEIVEYLVPLMYTKSVSSISKVKVHIA
jgi:hypothetical protein